MCRIILLGIVSETRLHLFMFFCVNKEHVQNMCSGRFSQSGSESVLEVAMATGVVNVVSH